ncbi:unnamed protein product [Durusdinium trenchii]|uniref:2-oxoglutarate dehydrogenase, mitochondrial n=1 Tax=Durusdinium trenchii TaxID=1381693 RepID=A0ABP0STT8_9DINO
MDPQEVLSPEDQQRFLMARLLLRQPKLALLDEPLANLPDEDALRLLRQIPSDTAIVSFSRRHREPTRRLAAAHHRVLELVGATATEDQVGEGKKTSAARPIRLGHKVKSTESEMGYSENARRSTTGAPNLKTFKGLGPCDERSGIGRNRWRDRGGVVGLASQAKDATVAAMGDAASGLFSWHGQWEKLPRGIAKSSHYDAVASGVNARYLENLYLQWKVNPSKLDAQWNDYFRALEAGTSLSSTGVVGSGGAGGLQNLIRAYQVRGHESANLDPLGLHAWRKWEQKGLSESVPELDPSFHGFSEADLGKAFQVSLAGLNGEHTLQEVVDTLKRTYSGSVGIEYMHIGDLQKIEWVRQRVEDPNFIPSDKNKLLKVYQELLKVDTFEQFLNVQYKTTKRFGVDGGEAAVAGVNAAIEKAAALGMTECVLGMPHRGRLNVLTNVVRKPLVQMFAEFKGTHYDFESLVEKSEGDDWLFAGDVKYHLGTSQTFSLPGGNTITATLEANPSHLETVNTVTSGRARAKQYYLGNDAESRTRVLPILFHGDASFAGQGVVYETMQLAHVKEFDVGGTIHVIINNQVGFTTDPVDDRSTMYTSDVGKTFNLPILHVNGDDPVAVISAFELAAEWRQHWQTDVPRVLVVGGGCGGQKEGGEFDLSSLFALVRGKRFDVFRRAVFGKADDRPVGGSSGWMLLCKFFF